LFIINISFDLILKVQENVNDNDLIHASTLTLFVAKMLKGLNLNEGLVLQHRRQLRGNEKNRSLERAKY